MKNNKRIIRYLEKEGRSPTSKISQNLGINYYAVETILKKLRREKLVISEKKGKGTFWIVK